MSRRRDGRTGGCCAALGCIRQRGLSWPWRTSAVLRWPIQFTPQRISARVFTISFRCCRVPYCRPDLITNPRRRSTAMNLAVVNEQCASKGHRPRVCVVDDAHWADASTVGHLRTLVRRGWSSGGVGGCTDADAQRSPSPARRLPTQSSRPWGRLSSASGEADRNSIVQ